MMRILGSNTEPIKRAVSRSLRGLLAVVAMGLAFSAPAAAQSQRALPRARFGTTDLPKLRWLEGRWRGSGPGEAPFYEGYHFANDSTLEITYYADSSFGRATGTGRVYLSVGRIYHTTGAGQWGATKVDETGAYFIPERNANNTFNWNYESADAWTSIVRSSATGQERVRVYSMRRIR
jgi:hypothetical protein